MSSYRVSFNDNDTLQCPESSRNVQHLKVVELGNSVEGRGRDVEVSVGEGDEKAEAEAEAETEAKTEVEMMGEMGEMEEKA